MCMIQKAMDVHSCIVNNCLRVRARPNARRSELLRIKDGVAYVAVAAPPEDGKANAEIERFFTRLAKRTAKIKSGFTSREKLIVFD